MLTVPVALVAPVPVFALQEATTPPVRVAPVSLPDVTLTDTAYKAQLSALFADPAKRPGLYVSLYNLIERETPPPHADVIVAQLMPFVSGANAVEAIVPLKILGMCGAAARPATSKVMLLATSPVDKVRIAAVEALGGMFYASQGVAPSAPVVVTTQLVRLLQSDNHRGVQRAAAVALGRCRVASRPAVLALAASAGADDTPVALGALAGLQMLGKNAKLALPALRNRLLDRDSCANAMPALFAVASPQEAVDAVTQTLKNTPATVAFYGDTANIEHVQTLLYHAERMPLTGTNTKALGLAVLPRTQVVPMPTGSADLLPLRLAAARTYACASKDAGAVASAFAGIAATEGDTATRRVAIARIGKIGTPALASPDVMPALQTVLASSNADLQGAAIATITALGGSGTQTAAPRLSELLLSAWKAKRNARVVSLMNALYQMGAGANPAKPALKAILAKEPPASVNAELAREVLENIAGGGTASR